MYNQPYEPPQSLRSFFIICIQPMKSTVKIKDWKEEERPREKMLLSSPKSLNNTELLAILIRSGTKSETAVDVSRKILSLSNNSLNTLSSLSIEALCKINGIGKTKAITILAALELAARMSSESPEPKPSIISSSAVVKIASPLMKNLLHEECWALYLNRANKLISKDRISIGGVSSTVMDVKLIIKKAVEKLASSIIIIHNHPSGNPHPGEQDKIQTKLLKEAAALLDIALLDHVIIAGNKHYSFSDEAGI